MSSPHGRLVGGITPVDWVPVVLSYLLWVFLGTLSDAPVWAILAMGLPIAGLTYGYVFSCGLSRGRQGELGDRVLFRRSDTSGPEAARGLRDQVG